MKMLQSGESHSRGSCINGESKSAMTSTPSFVCCCQTCVCLPPVESRADQCQRDRERPVYNLKEALMARCYIEVLGLDKHSEAAQRLIKWKQPVEGQVGCSPRSPKVPG